MGLLDRIKSITALNRPTYDSEVANRGDLEMQASRLIETYLQESCAGTKRKLSIVPSDYPTGRTIVESEAAIQVACILVALPRYMQALEETWNTRKDGFRESDSLRSLKPLVRQLLLRRQPYASEDISRIVEALIPYGWTWHQWVPLYAIIRNVDSCVTKQGLSPEVRLNLEKLRSIGGTRAREENERKAMLLIDKMLGRRDPDEVRIEEGDDWGHEAAEALRQMDPADRAIWLQILSHAKTANGTKPSKAWLARAGQNIAAMDEEGFKGNIIAWLGFLKSTRRDSTYKDFVGHIVPSAIISESNGTLLKGLIWYCTLPEDDAIALSIGDAGEACFKKIPWMGARSVKAGNACLYSLGAMSGLRGVMQLHRLQQRVQYPSAQRLINAAFEQAAKRLGLTRDDLDDLAVPTFDLESGRVRYDIGGYRADIFVVSATQIDTQWLTEDGIPLKSEPPEIKRNLPGELKALKSTTEEIRKMLAAQRNRVERLLGTGREWIMPRWRDHYLDHPLLSTISRRLIWRFQDDSHSELGVWRDGEILDIEDHRLSWLTDETCVRLWHPIESEPGTVLAWRLWLERHSVTQPFKQAHREVYILTDAELDTGAYSNRFAAHVLRQHQLRALCQQRGWGHQLFGTFDGGSDPTLELPRWGLRARFLVDGIQEYVSESGICLYVTTDQVRFTRLDGREALPLSEIPPLVFSEVMRDVDLFVGVCSVGNDPNWQDTGPEGYQDYWQRYSFGDLSTSAQTRGAVLERLLPRLRIAERCSLSDRFLNVRGDLRTYKIHLGSGNILMEPNNQYLCIVPKRGTDELSEAGKVFLPFEGDNILAIILSKAFLLADDRSIKDPIITRQIRMP